MNSDEQCHFSCYKQTIYYFAGWVVYSSQRNSHYRLSIIYAKLEDSDTFTCVSQHGLASSLSVTVTSLSCPPLVTNAR